MAVRLRGLADRCIFCSFSALKSRSRSLPPIFTQRLPGTVGTVRFRSVKTKPALRALTESRQSGKKLTVTQLYNIVQAVLDKLKPPPLGSGQQEFYDDTNTSPDAYYYGLEIPARAVQKQFRNFSYSVLHGLQKSEFSDHGTFIVTTADVEAAIHESSRGLNEYLVRQFLTYIHASTPDAVGHEALSTNLKKAADLRFPQEWYPATRQFQRTWYLHVGPTNSGKTYHALQRLMESGSGCYAGPLRLLAHEVFERMNAQGYPCNLVTGDDRQTPSDTAQLTSCTVEMVDVTRAMEVCVLDEIQMIGDPDRGWAWTQALMGVKAKEVHLCGEERTIELIQNLAGTMGDKLVIRHYKRLGPLEVMPKSLGGNLRKLERGDCVVTFSRTSIFALQREIQKVTGKKCAVIYGSLPPETRAIQAKLFNNPDNDYEILVASDAVGMGLNLSVKRIIFETTIKWSGTEFVSVSIPAIKQIAGRAGRYRVAGAATPAVSPSNTAVPLPAAPCIGYVTTLDQDHHQALSYAMSTTPRPLKTAGILPSTTHIEEFAALFPPKTSFHEILQHLQAHTATTQSLFHLCSFNDHLKVARALHSIPKLSVAERLQFCMAPIPKDPAVQCAALEMAQRLADNRDAGPLKIESLDLEVLDIENPSLPKELRRLEGLHKALLLYLWLSWRFPATFTPRETAQDIKVICEAKIDLALQNIKTQRKKVVLDNPVAQLLQTEEAEIALNDVADDEEELDMETVLEMEEDEEEEEDAAAAAAVPHVPLADSGAFGFVPKEAPLAGAL